MEIELDTPEPAKSSAYALDVFQPFLGMEPQEFRELASKILVLIPCRSTDGINPALTRTIHRWGSLGTLYAPVIPEFDGHVEFTRGATVKLFLEICRDFPTVEYLVMIDNDEGVPWDAPYKLAHWGKDIVSGVVCNFSLSKGGVFACIIAQDKLGIGRFPTASRTKKMPTQGLREIYGAGTGLLCVHKRVFEAIVANGEHPFEIPEEIRRHAQEGGTLKQGEDMAFCARARNLGFKIYVDFSARADHFKTIKIAWPEVALDPTMTPEEWQVSADDFVHT